MTAHGGIETAIEAMKRGAYDFVTKPFATNELRALVHKALEKRAIVAENETLRAQLVSRDRAARCSVRSEAMRRILDLIAEHRPRADDGAHHGRERHRQGADRARHPRGRRPQGHSRSSSSTAAPSPRRSSRRSSSATSGAPSRARSRARLGLFREADGGTVLLDEVGELAPAMQVKLLRVLQERKVRSVGATTEVPVDVRVLAATNRNVEEEVRSGPLPAGPLLPAQRHPRRGAAAPRAPRGHPPARGALPRAVRGRAEQGHPRALARRAARARGLRASRATCASSRTSSSAPWRWQGADHRPRRPAAGARGRRVPGRRPPSSASPRRAATSTRCSARSSGGCCSRRSSGRAGCGRRRRSSSASPSAAFATGCRSTRSATLRRTTRTSRRPESKAASASRPAPRAEGRGRECPVRRSSPTQRPSDENCRRPSLGPSWGRPWDTRNAAESRASRGPAGWRCIRWHKRCNYASTVAARGEQRIHARRDDDCRRHRRHPRDARGRRIPEARSSRPM